MTVPRTVILVVVDEGLKPEDVTQIYQTVSMIKGVKSASTLDVVI